MHIYVSHLLQNVILHVMMALHVWQVNGVILYMTVLTEKMKKIVAHVSCLLGAMMGQNPHFLAIFSDNPEGSNDKNDCENNGDFFCECDGSCISANQVCNGINNCCSTYHGIGSTNVTCVDFLRGTTFKAPDELCIPETETEY